MKVTSYRSGEPAGFAFTAENQARAKQIITRYPEGRQASAVIALLDLAQRQNGNWLSPQAVEYVANELEMAPIRVHEVASFYTMFNLEPVGRNFIQVCRTTPCWLRGSDDLTKTCLRKLGTKLGETTGDGAFTVVEVECLGACANAPMVQINDLYYEDLTPERMAQIIDDLGAGKDVPMGSQIGRHGSAPEGGPLTLVAAEFARAGATRTQPAGQVGSAAQAASDADDEPAAEPEAEPSEELEMAAASGPVEDAESVADAGPGEGDELDEDNKLAEQSKTPGKSRAAEGEA